MEKGRAEMKTLVAGKSSFGLVPQELALLLTNAPDSVDPSKAVAVLAVLVPCLWASGDSS